MRQEGHLSGSTERSTSKEMKITSLYPSKPPGYWALWGSLQSLDVTAVTYVPVPTLSTDYAEMTQVPVCLTGKVTHLTPGEQRQTYVMGSYKSHSFYQGNKPDWTGVQGLSPKGLQELGKERKLRKGLS